MNNFTVYSLQLAVYSEQLAVYSLQFTVLSDPEIGCHFGKETPKCIRQEHGTAKHLSNK